MLAGDFIKTFDELASNGDFVIAPEALSRLYVKGDYGNVGANWMTKEDRENEISDYINYLDELFEKEITPYKKDFSFEVNALMALLVDTVKRELSTLNKNNIRLQAIGDLSKLPDMTRKTLLEGIEQTKNNTRMTLILALNYSSRWEIVEAVKKIATQVKDGLLSVNDITSDIFSEYLTTKDIPDPELMIRTSGEHRISNYLLWQAAYAELYFTSVLWPDFRKEHFYQAILDFQGRERRFGKISEQLIEVQ